MNLYSSLTIRTAAIGVTLSSFLILNAPTVTAGASMCAASGSNLKLAKKAYAQSCSVPFQDCDPIGEEWVCANQKINPKTFPLTSLNKNAQPYARIAEPKDEKCSATGSTLNQAKSAFNSSCNTSFTDCDYLTNKWVCANYSVETTNYLSKTPAATEQPVTPVVTNTGTDSVCIDTDGDGWGWTGTESCKVVELPANSRDTSNESYSYQSVVTNVNNTGSRVPDNCNKLNSGNYHITELVTDVFLSAGQSNATGGQTAYNPWNHHKDRVNDRIIVWTQNNRWEVADPQNQIWHNGRYPNGQNHPAFQIARAITEADSCRVVAFIATAASGMPIDYWRHDVEGHYSSILNKVPAALNALPGKYKIDMIWWMQGEADDDQYVARYFFKLTDLINRFRSQNWFDTDGLFLANETRIHLYANEAIRMLDDDDSEFTGFSRGADSPDMRFPSILPVGVHFNATSLRQIGDLVAGKYLYQYLPLLNR